MVVRGFEGRYRVVIWFPARSCAAGPQLTTYPVIPTVLFDCIFCFISPILFIPPSGTFLWQEQKARCCSSMLLPFVPRMAGSR